MKIDLSLIRPKTKQPLHEQLAMLIREAIAEGIYLPGERIEPEREFLANGEFSRPVVSAAFQKLAADGLVHRRVGAGTFVANPSNHRTRVQRIGYLSAPFSAAHADVLAGIEQECTYNAIEAITVTAGEYTDVSERQAMASLVARDVQAIIASPTPIYRNHTALLDKLAEHDVPLVLAGTFLPPIECDTVTAHNEEGAYQLTQHLIRCGHRRISLLATKGAYPTRTVHLSLLKGRNRALRDAGLTDHIMPPLLLPPIFDEQRDTDVQQLVADHLAGPDAPTAILCMSDKSAAYVMTIARRVGMSIPGDLSITGFGDFPFAQNLTPALTTVAWPLKRIGQEAVRLAIARARNPRLQLTRMILETRLIVRDSVVGPR